MTAACRGEPRHVKAVASHRTPNSVALHFGVRELARAFPRPVFAFATLMASPGFAAGSLRQRFFEEAWIVLSGNLDEIAIWQILKQIEEEAEALGMNAEEIFNRLAYGVGTRLITSWGAPALSAAFKLVGVKNEGSWKPAIKVSDSPAKVPNPGDKNLWRIYDKRGYATADLVGLRNEDPREMEEIELRHPADDNSRRVLHKSEISKIEPLLADVYNKGELICDLPTMENIRELRNKDLARLDPGVKRLINPHIYHVSLSRELWDLKKTMLNSSKYGHAVNR